MKKETEIMMRVTPQEEELIKAIRNYLNSYPNGHPQLLDYAEMLFDNMTDPFRED
ncbi:MAG: hypothetical protein ACI3YG_09695 [Prevotella sp.]